MSGPTCSPCGADQSRRLVEVLAPERIGDDLDGLQAELEAAIDVPANVVGRLAERIDRAIGEHPVALPRAEHRADALAAHLAAKVPQRDVDGRDRVDHDAPAAVVAGQFVHAIPKVLDIVRIGADQNLLEAHRMGVGAWRVDDRPDDGGDAVHFRNAGNAFVGVDENQAIVV